MVKNYNKMALRGMPMTDEEHASEMALNTGIIIPSELFHTPAYNDFILDAIEQQNIEAYQMRSDIYGEGFSLEEAKKRAARAKKFAKEDINRLLKEQSA